MKKYIIALPLLMVVLAFIACEECDTEPLRITNHIHAYEFRNSTTLDITVEYRPQEEYITPNPYIPNPILVEADGSTLWNNFANYGVNIGTNDTAHYDGFDPFDIFRYKELEITITYADGTTITERQLDDSRKLMREESWELTKYPDTKRDLKYYIYTFSEEDYLFAKSLEGENQTK